LEPYSSSVASFDESFRAVRQQNTTGISPDNIAKLKLLCAEKLAELDMTINLRRTRGLDAAAVVVDSGVGKPCS